MGHRGILLAITLAALAVGSTSQPALAASTCDYAASPSGSDSASGTVQAPYRTVQRLVSSLSPGQVGCLRAGTYTGNVKVSRGGGAGAPIRLTSYGAEKPRVVGRFWIANGADHVVVDHLVLDGRSTTLPSPSIYASDVAFRDNEVTNAHTAICFNIGQIDYGWFVRGAVIERNHIHDCGKLPSANHDHGIYVENSSDTRIAGNLIHDNADRGINLYPNARRTTITGNVIANNGEGILFSGDFGQATTDTLVQGNVIAYSKLRYNVEAWFPAGNPTGTGNAVRRNCFYKGARGNVDAAVGGASIALDGNLVSNPGFVDRGRGDFRMSATSPCAALLAGVTDAAGPVSGLTLGTDAPAPTSGTSPPPATSPGPPDRPPVRRRRSSSAPRAIALRATRRGRRVRAQVELQGKRAGRTALQVRRGGGWRNLAHRYVRAGKTARISVTLSRDLPRRVKLRARTPGVGVSPTVVLRVR